MNISVKHPINLHKGLTLLVVLGMMLVWQNFSVGAWVYLALHGTYGVLWLLKDAMFPDPKWEEPIALPQALVVFVLLGTYWIAPFLLISRGVEPPVPLIAGAIALNILGVFLHYASDAQKYFVLQARSGLIDDGFFARTRNPNYLGEMLIYAAFALLAMHWLPWVILVGFWAAIFWPNMQVKERSPAILVLQPTKGDRACCSPAWVYPLAHRLRGRQLNKPRNLEPRKWGIFWVFGEHPAACSGES